MGQDRGTYLSILKNPKTSQYAWNSVPIENTDVSGSLAAVGKKSRSPLDIELSAIPELNDEYNSTLYNYLWNISSDASLTTSVVQVLVEEPHEAHRQLRNKGKIQPTL